MPRLIGQYKPLADFFEARWLGSASLFLLGLLAVILAFYLAYRWVASHQAQIVIYVHAVLSYPPAAQLRPRYERQLRWLLRRLTPGEYLGLHLTIGLLMAVGCLWFFGDLAEDVATNDPLVRFDQKVAIILHHLATPNLTIFFLIITGLGSGEVLGLLGLIITVIYGLRRRWLQVATWLAAVAGGIILNQLLKEFFARSRPSVVDPLLSETGYSFPSGHAMLSLIAYGMLTYFGILALQTWRARTTVVFVAVMLVVLIGISRMYIGVHYFSDVVAGFSAGGMWLSALITGMETIRRRNSAQYTKPPPSHHRHLRF
jgi:membrane-associated phospholipid phosphatase